MARAYARTPLRHGASHVNAVVLGCAYAMDLIVGDPEWFPHPVRAMGRMIAAGEAVATPGRHAPVRDFVHGALVAAVVVAATATAAVVALRAVRLVHPGVALVVEVLLAWT